MEKKLIEKVIEIGSDLNLTICKEDAEEIATELIKNNLTFNEENVDEAYLDIIMCG